MEASHYKDKHAKLEQANRLELTRLKKEADYHKKLRQSADARSYDLEDQLARLQLQLQRLQKVRRRAGRRCALCTAAADLDAAAVCFRDAADAQPCACLRANPIRLQGGKAAEEVGGPQGDGGGEGGPDQDLVAQSQLLLQKNSELTNRVRTVSARGTGLPRG